MIVFFFKSRKKLLPLLFVESYPIVMRFLVGFFGCFVGYCCRRPRLWAGLLSNYLTSQKLCVVSWWIMVLLVHENVPGLLRGVSFSLSLSFSLCFVGVTRLDRLSRSMHEEVVCWVVSWPVWSIGTWSWESFHGLSPSLVMTQSEGSCICHDSRDLLSTRAGRCWSISSYRSSTAIHEAYTSLQLQLSSTTSPYVKRLLNLVVKVFQLVEAI